MEDVGPFSGACCPDWAPLTGERFWERASNRAVTRRGAWRANRLTPLAETRGHAEERVPERMNLPEER